MIAPPYRAATPASEAEARDEEEVETETTNYAHGFAEAYVRYRN